MLTESSTTDDLVNLYSDIQTAVSYALALYFYCYLFISLIQKNW